MPPAVARLMVPRGFLIGRSVHSLEEAEGVAGSVDYLIAGAVWPTASKPGLESGKLLGSEGLSRLAHQATVPVLAIGGASIDRIGAIARSGAAGVAAIGLFIGRQQTGDPLSCGAVPLHETVRAARGQFDTPEGAS